MTHVVVSTDGYASEDAAAWAFIATQRNAEEPHAGALPPLASHLAEWRAAAEALHWAESHLGPGDTLDLRTDSALVAKGLGFKGNHLTGLTAEFGAACGEALERLALRGVKVHVLRVRREENGPADRLARETAARAGTGRPPA